VPSFILTRELRSFVVYLIACLSYSIHHVLSFPRCFSCVVSFRLQRQLAPLLLYFIPTHQSVQPLNPNHLTTDDTEVRWAVNHSTEAEREGERSTPEGLDMPFRVGLREGSWCTSTHGPYSKTIKPQQKHIPDRHRLTPLPPLPTATVWFARYSSLLQSKLHVSKRVALGMMCYRTSTSVRCISC
jgi:hypothetical protein